MRRANPSLILNSKSLVMRNVDEMRGKILGYNIGHDKNDYWALKYQIQNLVDGGMLEFTQDGQTKFFCRPSKAHHLK